MTQLSALQTEQPSGVLQRPLFCLTASRPWRMVGSAGALGELRRVAMRVPRKRPKYQRSC